MTVIYNFIATSVLGIPFEKVYGFITYSNVLFIEYKIKWSMYLLEKKKGGGNNHHATT